MIQYENKYCYEVTFIFSKLKAYSSCHNYNKRRCLSVQSAGWLLVAAKEGASKEPLVGENRVWRNISLVSV